MLTKITPDLQKANALVAMAKVTLERLKETDRYKYPTNTVTDYYDSIHKLLESFAYRDGVKTRGDGAHQVLIDFICQKYQLGESIRIFLQDLREYRNRISYEGFTLSEHYLREHEKKIEQIILKLMEINIKNK